MKEFVKAVPDYPKKGIIFRDIAPLLSNSSVFKEIIDQMTEPWIDKNVDAVLSIESRGFIMAGAIAYKLSSAFIPLRKPNKLPRETFSVSYDLEYGSTEMHIHKDALDGLTNVIIIDDLLATGGTALAAIELVSKFKNKKILGASFIIDLPDLNGSRLLEEKGINVYSLMQF
ncbi:MAG: Adenine phosphoribosyltransferase [Alphaproteobacteria bacterium MarineAlpha2_Bin1]|nr:MAG: Adenine phosphoribosyltransferase [Alphaproteobacteria bacterium MarineAlpha2_Bin1]|tara:strand:+ start:2241 stop:2756 length:516 start_codon:yes stop_codon:yes gene_type:complete